jgi:phage-related protein
MTVFDLMAKIGLDTSGYDSALKGVGESFNSFGAKLKTGIATAGKTIAAGTAAVGAGVTALTKMAVESYSNYEQLAGGVDTLFKDAGERVKQFAEDAYKTAGLSANEYMETVTSFSASLIQSLDGDTAKAAEYADRAIIDMADNANKMGTSISMIQNAYQGFAKQNYTMLDNLKLGYGGTQTEMYRLMKDAEKLGAVFNSEFSLSSKGTLQADFADITTAIHVIQENMGIAGATAQEAEGTIQGSLAMVSSSWKNLITDIVIGGDALPDSINKLVSSVGVASKNLMPAIKSALAGIATLIEEVVPILIEALPDIIKEVVPALGKAIKTILSSAVKTISSNKQGIENALKSVFELAVSKIKDLPKLLELGKTIFNKLKDGIKNSLPQLLETGKDVVVNLTNFILENLPELLKTGIEIITSIANFISQSLPEMIPTIISIVLEIVTILTNPDTLIPLLDAAIAIILALVEGIIYSLPQLLDQADVIITQLMDAIIVAVPKLLNAAKEIVAMVAGGILANLDKILAVGVSLVMKFIEGIYTWSSKLYTTAVDAVNEIKEGFNGGIEAAKEWGADLIDNFINGIKEKWENLKNTVTEMAQMVQDFIGFSEPKMGPLSNFHTYAPDMMDLFAKGIKDNKHKVTGELSTALYGVENTITSVNAGMRGGYGNITNNIHISGATFANSYDTYRTAEEISRNLKQLQIRDMRAIGGY